MSATSRPRCDRPRGHCQRGALSRAGGQGLRHIGAIAHAGLDIALGQQALHGPQHRVARYAQQPAWVREGGNRVPAGQRPCSMALRNCAYTCWRKVADEGAALGVELALAMGTNWLPVDALWHLN